MTDEHKRLMTWRPDALGYTRDDIILAVGVQCRDRRFDVTDALVWMGTPNKATGDSAGGYLVYYFDSSVETAAVFDIADGKVIDFGTVAKSRDNAERVDEQSGRKIYFNMLLDEMGPFDKSKFK